MTYGGFLLIFLVGPIVLLTLIQFSRLRRRRWLNLALLMVVALIYTTPWDNYLVASRVWWYDPAKVSGIVFGYVPLEEYLFFLLQPLMSGLLLIYLSDLQPTEMKVDPRGTSTRWRSVAILGGVWLVFLGLLLFGPEKARYLSLELAWALPPLMLQLAFGADILRSRWRPAVTALLISTSFLLAADALAISQGIWMISPSQTLGWNPLPVVVLEEAVFFLMTNSLVIGGLTLLEDPRSIVRLRQWRSTLSAAFASSS